MKKTIKRGIVLAVAFVMAFALVITPRTFESNAELYARKTYKYSKSIKHYAYSGDMRNEFFSIKMGKKLDKKSKVKVSVSKKSVVKYIARDGKELYFKAKKAGKATLKIKVKKGSRTKTYKVKLKVIAYKNPVKRFTINGVDITSQFNKDTYIDYKLDAKTATLNVVPASGWKITKMVMSSIDEGYNEITKPVSNNIEIALHDKELYSDIFEITLVNNKTKQKLTLEIWIE